MSSKSPTFLVATDNPFAIAPRTATRSARPPIAPSF